MAKSVLIVGDINDKNTTKLLEIELSNFVGVETKISDILVSSELIMINPIDNKINVDQIDNYIEHFTLYPLNGTKRIGIISCFDIINQKIQNKLLKTIEDASSDDIHIFIASHLSNLLPTIMSRVYVVNPEVVKIEHEDKFIKQYCNTYVEVNYLNENKDVCVALKRFEELMVEKNYNDVFKLYTIQFQKLNQVVAQVLYKIVLVNLKNHNHIDVAYEITEYEKRFLSNANLNAQFDAIMCIILKELVWS